MVLVRIVRVCLTLSFLGAVHEPSVTPRVPKGVGRHLLRKKTWYNVVVSISPFMLSFALVSTSGRKCGSGRLTLITFLQGGKVPTVLLSPIPLVQIRVVISMLLRVNISVGFEAWLRRLKKLDIWVSMLTNDLFLAA